MPVKREAEIGRLPDCFGHCKHAKTRPANEQINKQTFAMQMDKVEERKQTNKPNEQLLLQLSDSLSCC